jgi:hypothetical protein
LDSLVAEVCVEVWHLDGEDVEHDGERAGVGGGGDSATHGLTGVVAEPCGGATDESSIVAVAVAVRVLRLRVCWHPCSSASRAFAGELSSHHATHRRLPHRHPAANTAQVLIRGRDTVLGTQRGAWRE